MSRVVYCSTLALSSVASEEADCAVCSCACCTTFGFSSKVRPAIVRTPACSASSHWPSASAALSCALAYARSLACMLRVLSNASLTVENNLNTVEYGKII